MRKVVFVLLLSMVFSSYAQEEAPIQKKNEVYFNAFNMITFKWFDVSYEHLLNEESSIGISTQVSLDNRAYGYDSYRKYAITPYYRHFFSNGYAKGFFLEAFTMLNSGDYENYIDYYDQETGNYVYDSETLPYTDFAFGIGVGGKFISKRGFIGEIHGGIGRNLFNDDAPEVVGRASVSFGFRF